MSVFINTETVIFSIFSGQSFIEINHSESFNYISIFNVLLYPQVAVPLLEIFMCTYGYSVNPTGILLILILALLQIIVALPQIIVPFSQIIVALSQIIVALPQIIVPHPQIIVALPQIILAPPHIIICAVDIFNSKSNR